MGDGGRLGDGGILACWVVFKCIVSLRERIDNTNVCVVGDEDTITAGMSSRCSL
jgi:hypothetical protein